jgi:hypothetical protein
MDVPDFKRLQEEATCEWCLHVKEEVVTVITVSGRHRVVCSRCLYDAWVVAAKPTKAREVRIDELRAASVRFHAERGTKNQS